MKSRIRVLAFLAAGVTAVLGLATSVAPTASAVTTTTATTAHSDGTQPGAARSVPVCATALPGHASCFARIRTDVHGGTGVRGPAAGRATAAAATLPAGLSPTDLRAAYSLPATGGAHQTVAIVDAGDDATAEADLAVYRTTYGLPACTTANGCFTKANQRGAATPLPPDQGWSVEIALDLDMVSAACSQCHILLVEADDATTDNLAASVDEAVALGANEVSNSYGGPESSDSARLAPHYSHPGVAILASSGDNGFQPASAPAVYSSVIAAGGTTLTRVTNARGWSETAWSGAGSGCSAWFAKPAWQTDPNCPGRMVADVAADADPNTGPAVYCTQGCRGWAIIGGTSASSPFLAGVVALGGHPGRFPDASYLYAHASGLNDVVGGNNSVSGMDCGGDYQCNAVVGYDGPTGWGTPRGLADF
ncbi:hypothetical protein ABH935_003455 [Catenulispora sp. GAS73]|uniref:S53 family peptidase n=1 Tax=Catenulispora sp. GAS73 TaxID=3156269 RepID=UPI003517EB12